MSWQLAYPWALWGLLALPALVAIYLLRQRYQRRTVSSLLLWRSQAALREGGRRLDRLQVPPSLLWELLLLLLLVLAAANPQIRQAGADRPLAVVLDDSFSMLATTGADSGAETPRQRAAAALVELLGDGGYGPVTLVLAGERAQSAGELQLGGAAQSRRLQVAAGLTGWTCASPSAALAEGIALGSEIAGPRGWVLVLSDQPPAGLGEETASGKNLASGRLRWWAFGRPGPNQAVVNAVRGAEDPSPGATTSCLLEVANLGDQAASTSVTVTASEASEPLLRTTLSLGPGEVSPLRFRLAAGSGEVRAQLGDDALAADNQVVLLPEAQPPVRVALEVSAGPLRDPLLRALEATGRALLVPAGDPTAGLLITDAAAPAGSASPDLWLLQVIAEADAASYLGPFVVDNQHPLADGLSLGGVIWTAGKSGTPPGRPVISAGNLPLLTDLERPDGRHQLTLRLRPELSTLPRSTDWPVLIWNLLTWRAGTTPGLDQTNLRLGAIAHLRLPAGTSGEVEVTDPQGQHQNLPIQDATVHIAASRPGVYTVRNSNTTWHFAVNALSTQESDLRGLASGRWGAWEVVEEERWSYRSLGWVALFLVILGQAVLASRISP